MTQTVPSTHLRGAPATRKALLLLGLVLACAACGWSFWHGAAVLRADLGSARARMNVQDWALDGRGWTVETWTAARQDLLQAQRITPDDPVVHGYLAQLYLTQGFAAWPDVPRREAYFAEAAEHLQAQLRLRPHDARAWASLAQARQVLRQPVAQVQLAWFQARLNGPHEPSVQQALETLVLATWDDATPEMQQWLRLQWRNGSAAWRKELLEEAKRYGREGVLN